MDFALFPFCGVCGEKFSAEREEGRGFCASFLLVAFDVKIVC